MNGYQGVIVVGPRTLEVPPEHPAWNMIERRSEVQRVVLAYLNGDRSGLASRDQRVLADVGYARMMQDFDVLEVGSTQDTKSEVDRSIRAMYLEPDQVRDLVESFVELWRDPYGCYVTDRQAEIAGQPLQIVCAQCPPDDNYGADEYFLLDRILYSGIGAVLGLI